MPQDGHGAFVLARVRPTVKWHNEFARSPGVSICPDRSSSPAQKTTSPPSLSLLSLFRILACGAQLRECSTRYLHAIATHPIATHPIATHPIATHPIATHPIATLNASLPPSARRQCEPDLSLPACVLSAYVCLLRLPAASTCCVYLLRLLAASPCMRLPAASACMRDQVFLHDACVHGPSTWRSARMRARKWTGSVESGPARSARDPPRAAAGRLCVHVPAQTTSSSRARCIALARRRSA